MLHLSVENNPCTGDKLVREKIFQKCPDAEALSEADQLGLR